MVILIPSVCPHCSCGELLVGEGLIEKLDGSGESIGWITRCLVCGSLIDAVEEEHEGESQRLLRE